MPEPMTLQIIEDAFLAFIFEQKHDVGQSFRNFYNIFDYVDESNIKDKRKYARYLTGLLSSHKQLMIFYCSVFGSEREGLKPLIEKYAIFENIDKSELINPYNHMPLYWQSAYGTQDMVQYFKS